MVDLLVRSNRERLPGMVPRMKQEPARRRPAALATVKAVHTLAFFSIGACLGFVLYSGIKKRSDRRAAIAGAVVVAEALIYLGNGMRCPLTGLAERFGADSGSVSDIYLPRWFADHIAEITTPIFAEAIVLHTRNVFGNRAAAA